MRINFVDDLFSHLVIFFAHFDRTFVDLFTFMFSSPTDMTYDGFYANNNKKQKRFVYPISNVDYLYSIAWP